jgi:lipid-A-disaccharide synthase
MKILVSAGEASGDGYAAQLVEALRRRFPDAEFFGCAGRRLREAGVRPIVRTEDLAVVGVFEVVTHIPRIYGEYRRLLRAVEQERPDAAILTDAPDFNLRLAARLHRAKVPTFYYVAPQVWAWRKGRLAQMRRDINHLLCIFPFEEKFFREHGVAATYVGHPLASTRPALTSRDEYFREHGFDPNRPLVALLPGSRRGEAERHLPVLREAVKLLGQWRPLNFVLPASSTIGSAFFAERAADWSVQVTEEGAFQALAHADLALVASGTATVEAALLGTPMVVFYRVSAPSWVVGKLLLDVPFYSMVNLLAGRQIVPELIQDDCEGSRLAAEAKRLLEDAPARHKMREDLTSVGRALRADKPAAERAAEVICEQWQWTGKSQPISSLAAS